MYKCGYVGILGKTNVGKSTLINKLVGEKVSIVSSKVQTTRQNIIGILSDENYQIVFVDTPGIHKTKNYLDKIMMKNVRNIIGTVDVIVYIVDSTKEIDKNEINYIKQLSQTPMIVGLSKTDIAKKVEIVKLLQKISQITNICAIVPFSSKKNDNIKALLDEILNNLPILPEKKPLYDENLYTPNSVRFMSSEIIREKTLFYLNDELPHGIAIEITKFDEKENIVFIDADLICEKKNHKKIILGRNGTKIKNIGIDARKNIENLLQKQVMLKIFVKVNENWRQNKTIMI